MPHRPRLLIWTENYWIGGSDRFVADLVRCLRDWPVEIRLAGNAHPAFDAWLAERVPEVLPRETIDIASLVQSRLRDVEARMREALVRGRAQVPATSVGGEDSDGPLVRQAAMSALRYTQDAANLPRLRALMRRMAPDVLLVNNGGYPGGESCRLAPLAARAAGVPRVIGFVHNMANPPAWPTGFENALDRRIDAATDVWLTAAERASARLAAERAVTRAKVRTIRYGVPAAAAVPDGVRMARRRELGFTDGALALVVIANFEPRKGVGVLLDALGGLRERGVEVRTALVGDGPLRPDLERRVTELGLGGNVCFTGWREDIGAILAAGDAFALPSISHECLPYVILEAMAHGLPVVSTDVAGIPEMVLDGVTGRVGAPGDAAALAAAIAELATDPDRRGAMGAQGRALAREQFTIERMTAEMAEVLGLPGAGA